MDNDNQDDLVNNDIKDEKDEKVDHIKVLRVDNVLN